MGRKEEVTLSTKHKAEGRKDRRAEGRWNWKNGAEVYVSVGNGLNRNQRRHRVFSIAVAV